MSTLPNPAHSSSGSANLAEQAPPSPELILQGLDPEQRRVATELSGPMCVLAGAGTGKTRAITHRTVSYTHLTLPTKRIV